MALSKIIAKGVDLTDTFAFTGTVTGAGGFTQGTKVSPTSGTTVDFTGIPSDVKVIYVVIDALDMSADGWELIQLGDSGGFETTGYVSAVDYPGSGNLFYANTASENNGLKLMYHKNTPHSGIVEIMRISSDQTQWAMKSRFHAVADSVSYSTYSAVAKTLSGALTQIRLTSENGSHTFVAGDINILYSA